MLDENPPGEYAQINWTFSAQRVAALHRLCVCPKEQGKGIGKKTVLLAQHMLVNEGIHMVRLDAFAGNPAALRLYEGMGYRHAGSVNFRKGLFFCYEKQL